MNKVVDIFATDIEKEARALLDFLDEGDLNIEELKLEADLKGNSTRPFSEVKELVLEQLAIVRLAKKLIKERK